MRAQVLTEAMIGHETLLQKAALVLGGTLFIALAAQVAVPFYPVPVTLQTLAILIVGLTFGSRLGALTLMAYLAEGAIGLPVFAGGLNGVALMGPTAGFLFGFVGMAWLAGLAVETGLARGVITTALCSAVITALLYLPGLAWPMAIAEATGISAAWAGASAETIWAHWVSPFLLGDVVKAVMAALMVAGGWSVLSARKG